MDSDQIYQILKNGSPEERLNLIDSAPENSFKSAAEALIGSGNAGVVVVAVTSMIMEYCNGRDPTFGASLAEAAHTLAKELYVTGKDHCQLIPTTLSNLASQHVNALSLLGRSEEVIHFSSEYIPFYEKLSEPENLPTIQCAKANALLNLNQVDEAQALLSDIDCSKNFGAKIEVDRLSEKIKQLKGSVTATRLSSPAPGAPTVDFMGNVMNGPGSIIGESNPVFKELLEKSHEAQKLDVNNKEHFKRSLDLLRQGEAFITKNSDTDNEWTIKGRLREATKIFKLERQPSPEKIAHSMNGLEQVLEWSKEQQHLELMSDAFWGIYLCHSRKSDYSKAADALISLRANLEKQRAGINDPYERGGAFSAFPHLFNALCEKLQKSRRYSELLEAMEASKGRGIADILTRQYGKAITDIDIYGSVKRLPALAKKHKFHYVSYFVDRIDGEVVIYQVVAGKDGNTYGAEPVVLPEDTVDLALGHIDPDLWGTPGETHPPISVPDASKLFAPLTQCIEKLMNTGVITKGDHICYTADENLNNIPLQYLHFCGERLIDYFSISKIHNSLQLELILKGKPATPEKACGFIVPARGDVESPKWGRMEVSLEAPIAALKSLVKTDLLKNEGYYNTPVLTGKINFRKARYEAESHHPDGLCERLVERRFGRRRAWYGLGVGAGRRDQYFVHALGGER